MKPPRRQERQEDRYTRGNRECVASAPRGRRNQPEAQARDLDQPEAQARNGTKRGPRKDSRPSDMVSHFSLLTSPKAPSLACASGWFRLSIRNALSGNPG